MCVYLAGKFEKFTSLRLSISFSHPLSLSLSLALALAHTLSAEGFPLAIGRDPFWSSIFPRDWFLIPPFPFWNPRLLTSKKVKQKVRAQEPVFEFVECVTFTTETRGERVCIYIKYNILFLEAREDHIISREMEKFLNVCATANASYYRFPTAERLFRATVEYTDEKFGVSWTTFFSFLFSSL